MDRNVKLQRAKMDIMTIQERADMDQNLQRVRQEMDYKLRLQQVHAEAEVMQDRAKIDTKVPIMSFRVFKDREYSRIPRGYGEIPGESIITEPATKVEWSNLLSAMRNHGYRGNSELYHIKPGCVPPEGLVILLCQEDVDKMVRAHKDTKKCALYIVTNYPFRGDGYDETSDEASI
ncbi:hypothetical protein ACQ4PT_046129 [Festuca glaucescens]